MKRILRNACCIPIFLLFYTNLLAQEELIPSDSAEFHEFLFFQKEVPNLGIRYFLPDFQDTSYLSSGLGWAKTDSGFVSLAISDLELADQMEEEFRQAAIIFEAQYLVFSEVLTFAGARQYFLNLVSSGDYLVRFEEISPSEDIVSLASYAHYAPVEKFKLRFASDYKLVIVTVIIVFFFLVAFSMIAFMLLMKARKNKKEHLLKEYDRLIVDPLTNLLFEKGLQEIAEMDQVTLNDYFPESLLSKPIFKEVLIERIIGLNKKMKGEFKEKLKALFRRLDLDKISIDSLSNKKWDQVAMGLVQINEMDLVEVLPKVKNLTNSSNFQVRSQAVATLLNLSEKVDLVFLKDQTYPLSLWQQMNFLRIIRFVSHQKNLNIEILFDSANPSIRIFGYKLVKILGRVDLLELVAKLAPSVSDEEKIEILEVYASLGAHMEGGYVNLCLRSENENVVLAAAKAASVIGDQRSIEILIELIHSESDFRKKQILTKSLYGLDRHRFDQLTGTSDDEDMKLITNHILDPMLQYV